MNQASVTYYALSLIVLSGDRLNLKAGQRYRGQIQNFWGHPLEGIDIPGYDCNIPQQN